MKSTKILLLILLMWLVPAAIVPLFDVVVWFPVAKNVSTHDFVNHRLHCVRSASFLTLSYFIVYHMMKKKPLSSVSPILVFLNFLLGFFLILIIKNGGSRTDWLLMAFGIICAAFLFLESKKESNKIFKDAW